MNCLQSVQAENIVKALQDAVKIIDNIIAGIPGMAGVKADTHFVFVIDLIYDCG